MTSDQQRLVEAGLLMISGSLALFALLVAMLGIKPRRRNR